MKITEVTRISKQRLAEELDRNNYTGFQTEDLVLIYETATAECWSEPMTADELLAEMDAWDAE